MPIVPLFSLHFACLYLDYAELYIIKAAKKKLKLNRLITSGSINNLSTNTTVNVVNKRGKGALKEFVNNYRRK